jgi:hypothetical protein
MHACVLVMSACVRVCACVRARERVCLCDCERVLVCECVRVLGMHAALEGRGLAPAENESGSKKTVPSFSCRAPSTGHAEVMVPSCMLPRRTHTRTLTPSTTRISCDADCCFALVVCQAGRTCRSKWIDFSRHMLKNALYCTAISDGWNRNSVAAERGRKTPSTLRSALARAQQGVRAPRRAARSGAVSDGRLLYWDSGCGFLGVDCLRTHWRGKRPL